MSQSENRDPSQVAIIDVEHLRLLSLGFKISGGISIVTALFCLLYVFIGVMLMFFPDSKDAESGVLPGVLIAGFSMGISALFALLAVAKFYAAHLLRHSKKHGFIMFMGALSCLGIPYGTILGVFTLIVLNRKSIRQLFV